MKKKPAPNPKTARSRMRQFYDAYGDFEIVSALLARLPRTHDLMILAQSKRPEEREFYLRLHLRNILEEGESVESAAIKEFLIVRAEGESRANSVIKEFLTTVTDIKNPGQYHQEPRAEIELPFPATRKKSLSVRGLTPRALCPPAQGCEL